MLMVRGTPESKAESTGKYKFDTAGVITFMIMMVGLQVVLTQGGSLGWVSRTTIGLLVVSGIFGFLVVRIEKNNPDGCVDFGLFKNMTYTGATISNFLLNATAGILIVAMSMVQIGGDLTAQQAGLLTVGYAIAIVAFIRVGEKLLQRFGPRKPMIWGALIVCAAIILLMGTNVLIGLQHPGHRRLLALRARPRLLRHPLDRRGPLGAARGEG